MMVAPVIMAVAIIGQHQAVHFMTGFRHVMLDMRGERLDKVGTRGDAFHRDGRKRLNRQAQYQ